MLREHDVPGFITKVLVKYNLTDEHYYLYGCGRAIAFARMAADALQTLGNEQKSAEYHGYVGISTARTAIDAAANWLRIHFNIRIKKPYLIDLAKTDFAKKLVTCEPRIQPFVECLGKLAQQIDPERQRAQHREGLALLFCAPGGWYLTKGLQAPRNQDEHCATLLRRWADDIQQQVYGIVQALGL